MKLGMVDYLRDPTPHGNFGGASATWVVCASLHIYILKVGKNNVATLPLL